jgi:hypothetical protein
MIQTAPHLGAGADHARGGGCGVGREAQRPRGQAIVWGASSGVIMVCVYSSNT